MAFPNPKNELDPRSDKTERSLFAEKFKDLLPGAEFDEPVEMSDARTAMIEALTSANESPDSLQYAWSEYAALCEQIVDTTATDMQHRALLQICFIVHKALIFRQTDDMRRYLEELATAYEYAYNMRFDTIADAIEQEIDRFIE